MVTGRENISKVFKNITFVNILYALAKVYNVGCIF
jgi:hypothetical protein